MKEIILLIINLSLLNFCFGQNTEIKGEIKDFKTGEPLPYATIEIFKLKTGSIADKDGKFIFKISTLEDPDRDSINFSYVGYDTKKMSLGDFIQSEGIIRLKVKPVILEEIKIIPKEYTNELVGIKDKKPLGMQYANIFGGNKGNFIENPRKESGWIKSVSYYIHPDGHPTAPFRIRIYAVDENRKPGKDILNKNVVVSANGPGWFKVDLSGHNISFPMEGAFVMMEWINSGDKYYFEKEVTVESKNGQPKSETRKYYGQSLGTVSKKNGVVLWGSSLGNEWIPYDFNFNGKYPNAMINAEILYEKN